MTNNTSTAILDNGRHVMILKFMDDGWADSLTDSAAPAQMPYFVGGEAYERMERKQGVTLTPYMLLCGILSTWFEPEKYAMPGGREALRKFLMVVLEDLRGHFEVGTLEQLIIDTASQVRIDHGSAPALRMLTAGCEILPESTLVRSNLVMNTWYLLERVPNVDRPNAMEMIVNVYPDIDAYRLKADRVEVVDYIYMVSLAFLERHEDCVRFFWHTAARRATHPLLKKRMTALAEGRREAFEDYRIWDEIIE